ncbi:hypothetical protein PHLH4_00140 [Pseudomonas sp. St316]|nr:hypothetical protein PHLH4_00140 [Pseudomonas sp. St316]
MAAAHSTSMQAAPPLSRASSAPTVFPDLYTDIASTPNPCGSELARDDAGTFNIDASSPTAIASKLSSHSFSGFVHRHRLHPQSLWEPSLLAMTPVHSTSMQAAHRYREQAQLPQFFRICTQTSPAPQSLWEPSLLAMTPVHSTSMQAAPPLSRASSAPTVFPDLYTDIASTPIPVGASLLAMTPVHSTSMQAAPPLSRASSAPTVFPDLCTDIASTPNPCGSELARDDAGTFNIDASSPTAIASKLSSHSFSGFVHRHRLHPQSLWEPSLLAMTAAHSTSMQAAPPLSRASSAPTVFPDLYTDIASTPIPVGAELARDGGGTFNIDASSPTAIASKLSSHSFSGFVHRHRLHPQSLWERACSR